MYKGIAIMNVLIIIGNIGICMEDIPNATITFSQIIYRTEVMKLNNAAFLIIE
jgi:hypothetical protein